MPQLLEGNGSTESAGSGANHCNGFAGVGCGGFLLAGGIVHLHRKALQPSDAHCLSADGTGALALALLLLGAQPGAELRQGGCGGNQLISPLVVLLPNLLNEVRHGHACGTVDGAPLSGTAQAAACLPGGFLGGIGFLDFLEGGQPLLHGKHRVLGAFSGHVGVFYRNKYGIIWHKHSRHLLIFLPCRQGKRSYCRLRCSWTPLPR